MGAPQVGPPRLRGGDKALVECLTCEPYTLFGVTKFVSWPIIVEAIRFRCRLSGRGDVGLSAWHFEQLAVIIDSGLGTGHA